MQQSPGTCADDGSSVKPFPLVLASASPRRKKLMSELKMPFKVLPSGAPEKRMKGETPFSFVRRLAVEKAEFTARRMGPNPALVVGADTVVVLNGKIYGKPRSPRHAARMLMELSGKTHRVYTGLAVVRSAGKKRVSAVDVSKVSFRTILFSEAQKIGRKHLDKSGSYACQDKSDRLVRKIEGDWQTVVGLPVKLLKKLLKQAAA